MMNFNVFLLFCVATVLQASSVPGVMDPARASASSSSRSPPTSPRQFFRNHVAHMCEAPLPMPSPPLPPSYRLKYAYVLASHGHITPHVGTDKLSQMGIVFNCNYEGLDHVQSVDSRAKVACKEDGQLTRKGYGQMRDLGIRLRELYTGTLIPSDHTDSRLVNLRAIQSDAGLISAKALSHGLYPSHTRTIPFDVKTWAFDPMVRGTEDIIAWEELESHLPRNPFHRDNLRLEEKVKQTIKYALMSSGIRIKTDDVSMTLPLFRATTCHEPLFPSRQQAAHDVVTWMQRQREWLYRTSTDATEKFLKQSIGTLLDEIVQKVLKAARNKERAQHGSNEEALRIALGNEGRIEELLAALHSTNLFVSYGSSLRLELLEHEASSPKPLSKSGNQHHASASPLRALSPVIMHKNVPMPRHLLRVFFNDQPLQTVDHWCDFFQGCPLEVFTERLKPIWEHGHAYNLQRDFEQEGTLFFLE